MKPVYLLIALLFSTACGNQSSSEAEASVGKAAYAPEKNPVDTIVLRRQVFQKQLASNGKLKAVRKSDLRFRTSGELAQLKVGNGQAVPAGATIAALDKREVLLRVARAEQSLARAAIEYEDALLNIGIRLSDTSDVAPERLRAAGLRSGYTTAQTDLQQARYELGNCTLVAPFAGVVANLKAKQHDQVSAGSEFCCLIDNSLFDVEFTVLETELQHLQKGLQVLVATFAEPQHFYKGRLTEINPVVDEKGMISVKAQVHNSEKLMDGMNVKVLVENTVPGKLVVPKSAVVIRDNQEVLFRYKDGKAMWTYVHTEMENSTSYAVIPNSAKNAELNPGDIVIISGNLSIADNSVVEIKK